MQFYQALQERLSRVPGVRLVGAAVTLPIGGDDFGSGYTVEGRPPVDPADRPHAGFQVVAPGYFAAMGIPLKEGRDVRPSDTRDTGNLVALVNETFARDAWPGQDPVGRRFRPDGADGWTRVIGLVGDIRHLGPSVPPRPEFYLPDSQRSFAFMAFVVRTDVEPHALVPSIRRAAAELDPNLPLANVRTMDEHVQRALARPRFLSVLVGAFGVLAVTLALIGIYAMMAWAVSERRQEIAIRMALGARRSAVAGMVLRKALVLSGAGILAGLAGARLAAGTLGGLLYGIQPTDPLTFGVTALLVGLVALAACYVPARRAIHIDPVALLR